MGLVLKVEAAKVVTTAIRKIHAGEVWLNRSTIANVLSEMTQTRPTRQMDAESEKVSRLTEREREVISLIGEGIRNKQIAERLFISEPTIRHYLTSIYEKLEVADRLELMIYAYQHNLAKLPTCSHKHQANSRGL
jgi:DNA-binding NarL/FixJ family response regulator